MAEPDKVEVLKDCRHYLDLINLCNKGIYIKSVKIPDILYDIAMVGPMFYTTYWFSVFCYENGFNLTICAQSFSIFIGCTQIALIYLTLTFEKSTMYETMDIIQDLVDYRKGFLSFPGKTSMKHTFGSIKGRQITKAILSLEQAADDRTLPWRFTEKQPRTTRT